MESDHSSQQSSESQNGENADLFGAIQDQYKLDKDAVFKNLQESDKKDFLKLKNQGFKKSLKKK